MCITCEKLINITLMVYRHVIMFYNSRIEQLILLLYCNGQKQPKIEKIKRIELLVKRIIAKYTERLTNIVTETTT